MLVNPALLFVTLVTQSPASQDAHAWPSAMGYSKISQQSEYVQRISKLLDRGESAQSGGPSLPPTPGPHIRSATAGWSIEERARYGEFVRMLTDDCDQAKALAAHGDVAGAKERLRTLLEAYPGTSGPLWTLVELDYRLGDYIEAYKVAAPYMRRGGVGSVKIMAMASLVAAKLGEVYPGQAEFCRRVIGVAGWSEYLPEGDSPEAVAAWSEVCIIQQFSADDTASWKPYLEDALKSYPTNPWICRLMSYCYINEYNYSGAIKLLETSLKGVRSGSVHDEVSMTLESVHGFLKKVGDGKPAWPLPAPASPPAGVIKP